MSASSSPVRVAVVGAGGIAKACHVPALAAAGDAVRIVAVCDIDSGRANELADAYDIPARHTDPAEMLATESPGLVIVATPPVAHRAAVSAALDAGAWVWCEKPPTLSLAEYDEIAAHEKDGGPYASYVFQHRFGSAARRLRQHIVEGELGAPLVAVCNTLWYRGHDYFEVPWRGKWETEGGGPTMGHGIHQMDLLLSLLGDWSEVHAVAATLGRRVETEDVSFAIVRFASGAIASVANSVLSPRETSYLRFDFTDATVEVEHLYGYENSNWRWTPAPHVTDAGRIAGWAPADNTPSSHRAQLTALLAAMRAGERPAASGADGRRVMELITAMYQSAITGRPVSRTELGPANPFYHSLNGGDTATAVARLQQKDPHHA
ncbi:Gfo/Idh/MocA family oxidoreductase [Nonomuraea turkmeniaca]|uniref:Gfo/Idh/MocA family oxidoreductase n=1 Tax=Nonomuraea turkmeniaca TaxID=103838 RepID=A0A5S4FKX4_9ACTN|nr:Gfo/Idh/MocA family oxidoreductase [Nonomuraea turkmeniaca]TMR21322.1 Gfo/Idh/MocA family oxidoreductase [Nonomuraea turkmeniaca]